MRAGKEGWRCARGPEKRAALALGLWAAILAAAAGCGAGDPGPGELDQALGTLAGDDSALEDAEVTDGASAGLRPLDAPRAEATFRFAWSYVGTFFYTGGSGWFDSPFGARRANFLLLEAPLSCAPRVVQLGVVTQPWGWIQPTLFLGQRSDGWVVQAIYRLNGGWPAVVTGLRLALAGPAFVVCQIDVHAVLAP